jgi:hypothetical protein
MKRAIVKYLAGLAGVVAFAAVANAQTPAVAVASTAGADNDTSKTAPITTPADDTKKTEQASLLPPIVIQHFRPYDKRGLNVFETPKAEGVAFTGFKIDFGGAFTQQFQGLDHSNTATAKMLTGTDGKPYDANKLVQIGHGFNNAVANLYINAQLAKGIRVSMTSFLSSRHHNETWVKDGYLLVDASPIDISALNTLMKYLTLRIGHFEVNYGDAHYRRTDNGNAMYNPLVGNYIMDAFTTEIGGEVYVRANGFMGMAGMTGGEVRGQVTKPQERSPTYLLKGGYDKQLNKDLRVRLMTSSYATAKSSSNTLYSGDRAGSRYYDVLENTVSTESAQAWSGAIQPGFKSAVHAVVVNPFMKYRAVELFGNLERVKGKAATEATYRQWNQYVGEAVIRLLPNEQAFLAARYNTAKGDLLGISNKVSADRYQVGGGFFLTPTVMLKGEYVNQKYNDFPVTDIRAGGKFKGYMIEGVVAF